VLAIETGATDFQRVIDLIGGDEDKPNVTKYEELIGSWMYIARLDLDGSPPLFAARKVGGGWTAKKVRQLVNAIFENNMLVDLDHKDVFRIDAQIDFFSFDGVLFVADKKNFETALNFREGMLRARDEIVKEFDQLQIFTDPNKITELVGDNVTRLRRLAQVKNSGYYRDAKYLNALKRLNAGEKWGLQYDGEGKLTATDNTIEDILRLLNNDRLSSKINDEVFDVDVKHRLATTGA
jgi:YD repeat-containing protein